MRLFKATRISILLAIQLAAGSILADTKTPRIWTDVEGRKVSATFIMLQGDSVHIQLANGNIHAIALELLSAEDQKAARSLPPSPLASALNSVPTHMNAAQAAAKVDELVLAGLHKANQKLSHDATRKDGKFAPLKPNPPLNDEQFVRRAYLDIAGRIPNQQETVSFLQSNANDKRMRLIDTLLESDGHVSHLYNYLAEMLRIVDHYGFYIRSSNYIQWMKEQIRNNRPWNELVYELLAAKGKVWNNGPAGYLLRDSSMPLDNLANTLSVFLGTDLSCAQCHDHPFAEWTQRDFYQMAAFFGATSTMTSNSDFPRERRRDLVQAAQDLLTANGRDGKSFGGKINNLVGSNLYDINDLQENRLRLPHDYAYKDGTPGEPVEPKLIVWPDTNPRHNAAYKTMAARRTGDVDGLRQSFAGWVTHAENPRFAMSIANRMWQRAFGLSLMPSVTQLDNPDDAYNPALLKHLTSEMIRLKFNLKEFMRILYNTRAYQSQATNHELAMGEPYHFQGPVLRRMSAEQAWDSFMTLVLGEPDKFKNNESDLYGRAVEMNMLNPALDAQIILRKLQAVESVDARIRSKAAGGLAMADTGGGMSEMNASTPDMTTGSADGYLTHEGLKLMRASELPQPAPAGHFLLQFGQSTRQVMDGGNREGNIPQILMLMNGQVQKMLTNQDSLVMRNMSKVASPPDKVESVFLSILNRRPTLTEKDIARQELAAHGDDAYADIIWALINTREFYFIQ
ncbi:DUF1549 domain-containing protein [Phragmitibacter flavus]|uniref:DUF1549 domain-containing protein n=1 Tax=Phragmitibacter flavus TaxID=2576071 RepID=A0A5R8K8G8_9BACT|nr:DUF1549 domain-containing protein [Phragmitibacter flavus]TLD68632.1 DUF1549 domain-containing protein [Phragmitibacter flavus]